MSHSNTMATSGNSSVEQHRTGNPVGSSSGNTSSNSNMVLDNNARVATKRKSMATDTVTDSSFSNQFSQRRMKRRLEKAEQDRVWVQPGNNQISMVPSNRDTLATARMWQQKNDDRWKVLKVGNKVHYAGPGQKKKLKIGNTQKFIQTQLTNYTSTKRRESEV